MWVVPTTLATAFLGGDVSNTPIILKEELSIIKYFIHILLNNMKVWIALFSGYFCFGLTTLIVIITNSLYFGNFLFKNIIIGKIEFTFLIFLFITFETLSYILISSIGFKPIFNIKRIKKVFGETIVNTYLYEIGLISIVILILGAFIEAIVIMEKI